MSFVSRDFSSADFTFYVNIIVSKLVANLLKRNSHRDASFKLPCKIGLLCGIGRIFIREAELIYACLKEDLRENLDFCS